MFHTLWATMLGLLSVVGIIVGVLCMLVAVMVLGALVL